MPRNQTRATEASNDSLNRSIGRRTCLKLVGSAAVSTAALGATGTAAAADRTVRVDEGDTETLDVTDDDPLEDTLIDVTADGANLRINVEGSDCVVRNVGVRGRLSEQDMSMISVTIESGGNCLFENCYFGDGSEDGQMAGVHVNREHAGEAVFRNVNVQQWSWAGINAKGPGRSDGEGGSIEIENCYARNNNVAGFYLGATGSTVRDSVVVIDDDAPTKPLPSGGTGRDMGGIWVRGTGRARDEVRNCDMMMTEEMADWSNGGRGTGLVVVGNDAEYGYREGTVLVEDSDLAPEDQQFRERGGGEIVSRDIGTDPTTSVPSGVPTSASEAANGGGSSSNDENDSSGRSDEGSSGSSGDAEDQANDENSSGGSNTVTVKTQTGDDVTYVFSVDGSLDAESTGDNVSGDTARGEVHGGQDEYTFSGEFTKFEYDGPIEIDVNGETVYRDGDS